MTNDTLTCPVCGSAVIVAGDGLTKFYQPDPDNPWRERYQKVRAAQDAADAVIADLRAQLAAAQAEAKANYQAYGAEYRNAVGLVAMHAGERLQRKQAEAALEAERAAHQATAAALKVMLRDTSFISDGDGSCRHCGVASGEYADHEPDCKYRAACEQAAAALAAAPDGGGGEDLT